MTSMMPYSLFWKSSNCFSPCFDAIVSSLAQARLLCFYRRVIDELRETLDRRFLENALQIDESSEEVACGDQFRARTGPRCVAGVYSEELSFLQPDTVEGFLNVFGAVLREYQAVSCSLERFPFRYFEVDQQSAVEWGGFLPELFDSQNFGIEAINEFLVSRRVPKKSHQSRWLP